MTATLMTIKELKSLRLKAYDAYASAGKKYGAYIWCAYEIITMTAF